MKAPAQGVPATKEEADQRQLWQTARWSLSLPAIAHPVALRWARCRRELVFGQTQTPMARCVEACMLLFADL